MDRTVTTWVTFVCVGAARTADLAVTFHFNPSLSREANPIVAHFGARTQSLLLSNLLLVVIMLYVPLMCFWRGRRPYFKQPPSNIWEFISLAFYRRAIPRGELLRALITGWPLPRDWFQVCRFFGVAGSWAVTFGSIVAAASWWGIASIQWYHTFYSTVSFHRYSLVPMLAGLVGLVLGAWLFLLCEYQKMNWKKPEA